MTNREKAKWVWDHVPALLICGMYLSTGVVVLGDAVWRLIHGQWLQCGKDLLVAAAVFIGAYLIWHFFEWLKKLWEKVDFWTGIKK
jgi:hypothetical protein